MIEWGDKGISLLPIIQIIKIESMPDPAAAGEEAAAGCRAGANYEYF
ncbi:MAG: hypothetical protein K5989_08330 [Lachnospiraceae bacterium]|nr:hypothetical protein [Lachnospiraceae bacterium]